MTFTKLEEFIFEKASETRLPGLSAAIVKGDEVIWTKGFGFRDLERGLAATPHTLYAIGSVTKSFTAIAIMQLVEQGKLNLHDAIDAYLPPALHSGGEPIRIWHLLTHSSGIPALGYAESAIRGVTGAGGSWLPIASYSDLLTFMANAQSWAVSKPGERWFYLNEGYVVLGALIEQCSGMAYWEYVRQYILAPLGMERSFFRKEEVEQDPDVATSYLITRDEDRRPVAYAFGAISADGGMVSNVLDLAKYIAMYLGWGQGGGTCVLSRSSVEAMQTPLVAMPLQNSPFGEYGYSYGLIVHSKFLAHKLVEHSGSVGSATAYMGFIPEMGVGIALLANSSGYSLSQLGMYGLALLLEEDPERLLFVQRERALRELEGMYETYKGTIKAQVKRRGDFLFIESRDKFNDLVFPLVPDMIGEKTRQFFTLTAGQRLPVEFRVHDGHIDVIVERYCLRKMGPLA